MGHSKEQLFATLWMEREKERPDGGSWLSNRRFEKKQKWHDERRKKNQEKRQRGSDSTANSKKNWKDQDKKLTGIPKNVLDHRIWNKFCGKCGQGGHLWYCCIHHKNVSIISGNKRQLS